VAARGVVNRVPAAASGPPLQGGGSSDEVEAVVFDEREQVPVDVGLGLLRRS
jgi:hypothetical protein